MSNALNHSDFTQSDGPPSPRADVNLPMEACEFGISISPGHSGKVQLRTLTGQQSQMSKAVMACMLVMAGCLVAAVLHMIGAPLWAQLIGVVLPWLMTLSLTIPKTARWQQIANETSSANRQTAEPVVTPSPARAAWPTPPPVPR